MKVTNQKPIVLSPIYNDTIANTFDPISCMEDIIAKPMFTPLVASNKVSIKANGQTLSSAGLLSGRCESNRRSLHERFVPADINLIQQ